MRLAFKDVLLSGGKNAKVDNVSQIESLKNARDRFLVEYRQLAKTTSVKVCIISKFCQLSFSVSNL